MDFFQIGYLFELNSRWSFKKEIEWWIKPI
jgi:hypothetical protein